MEVNLFILVILLGIYYCTDATVVDSIEEIETIYDKALIQQLITTVNEMKERDIRTQKLLSEQNNMIKALQVQVNTRAKEIVELKALVKKENKDIIDKLAPTNEDPLFNDTNTRTTSDERGIKQVKENRATVIEKANHSVQRRAALEQGVAFFATLGTTVEHLGTGQNVKFEKVVTNIGNGYNPNLGAFIAPIAGTYVFSTTLTTYSTHSSHYGFFKNGVKLTVIWVNGAESSYDSNSQTIVVRLAVGDDVEVRCIDSDHAVDGYNQSVFSGFWLIDNASDAIVG